MPAGRHQPADACQCGCPQGLGVAGGLDVLLQVANLLGWPTSKPGRGGRCGAVCAHRLLHTSLSGVHAGHQQSSTASAMPSRTLSSVTNAAGSMRVCPKGTALKKALTPTPASERSPASVAGLALASCMAQAAKSTRCERACCVLERAMSRVTVWLAGKLLLRGCSVSTTAREAKAAAAVKAGSSSAQPQPWQSALRCGPGCRRHRQ